MKDQIDIIAQTIGGGVSAQAQALGKGGMFKNENFYGKKGRGKERMVCGRC
jgi:hypothetical protein